MKLLICVVVFLQVCSQQLLANPTTVKQCSTTPTTAPTTTTTPTTTPTPEPCKEGDLHITVDNKAELYFDDKNVTDQLSHADDWRNADTIKVPASVQVIGVKGVDWHVVAGILASGAYSTTDDSWRCTDEPCATWNLPSYDDSHWPNAIVIGLHNAPGDLWGTIAGISLDAQWIWAPNHQYNKTVYCRKKRTCACPPATVAPSTPLATTATGSPCITSCRGRANGDYQSCKGCTVFATCSNGLLYDQLPCASAGPGKFLYWDDNKKRCDWESDTCKYTPATVAPSTPLAPTDSGAPCITSCSGRADGDYQSCKGCTVYASCSNGILTDPRPCPYAGDGKYLFWDDNTKTCEWESATCK